MVNVAQHAFTAGEITPRLEHRTDIEQRGKAVLEAVNSIPVIHGGARRRPGSRLGRAVKDSADETISITFAVSRTLSFTLEFGDGYVRVHEPDGVYTGIELVSPYTSAQLLELDFAQKGDSMYLTHPSVFPQRIKRYGATAWELIPVPFSVPPLAEIGHTPAAALTLSATSGAAVTVTAGAAAFLVSDVGRSIMGIAASGIGIITSFSSSTSVTMRVIATFASTSVASGGWELDVSPVAFCRPSAVSPVGATITLSGAVGRAASLTLSAKTGAITITASASVFVPGDAGKVLYADGGTVTLAYSSGTVMTGTTTTDFVAQAYPIGSWGITGDTWRSGDVGSYVFIGGGIVRIDTYTSATSVSGVILAEITGLVAAVPLSWSLEGATWNATRGYPRTVTFHDQRLLFAGTVREPQHIDASVLGVYLDFTRGTLDSDAWRYEISSAQANPILYLQTGRVLIAHTSAGEFSLQAQTGKSLTATSPPLVRLESDYGARNARPVRAGRQTIFVQKSGRKIRSMAYDFNTDAYASPDLAAFAEHITKSGVRSLAYQQEPEPLLWISLNDGTLLSCTLDADQSVVAWAKHYLSGVCEWVSVLPRDGTDQVVVVMRRYVNSATVRTLEYLDDEFEPIYPVAIDPNQYPPIPDVLQYGCTLDGAIAVDNVAGQTAFTGLGHLEGLEVSVIADACYLGEYTVTAGAITISRASYRTLIGLNFSNWVKLLTPDLSTGKGTAQGIAQIRQSRLALAFLETYGCEVEDAEGRTQTLKFDNFSEVVLGDPPVLFSGWKVIDQNGWHAGKGAVIVRQVLPLPWFLLGAVRDTDANN